MKEMYFQRNYQPGINAYTDNNRKQHPERIAFMEFNDETKPVFRVIGNHSPQR
jgi:hypothetical protein